MAARYCPKCGAQIEAGVRFCQECGSQVQAPKAKKQSRRRKRKKAIPMPLLVMGAGGALLVVGLLFYLLAQDTPATGNSDNTDLSGLPYPDVPRITIADTVEKLENGEAIIVDVRSQEQYEAAHIPGAIAMPLTALPSRYQELPQWAEIITYCT